MYGWDIVIRKDIKLCRNTVIILFHFKPSWVAKWQKIIRFPAAGNKIKVLICHNMRCGLIPFPTISNSCYNAFFVSKECELFYQLEKQFLKHLALEKHEKLGKIKNHPNFGIKMWLGKKANKTCIWVRKLLWNSFSSLAKNESG